MNVFWSLPKRHRSANELISMFCYKLVRLCSAQTKFQWKGWMEIQGLAQLIFAARKGQDIQVVLRFEEYFLLYIAQFMCVSIRWMGKIYGIHRWNWWSEHRVALLSICSMKTHFAPWNVKFCFDQTIPNSIPMMKIFCHSVHLFLSTL